MSDLGLFAFDLGLFASNLGFFAFDLGFPRTTKDFSGGLRICLDYLSSIHSAKSTNFTGSGVLYYDHVSMHSSFAPAPYTFLYKLWSRAFY